MILLSIESGRGCGMSNSHFWKPPGPQNWHFILIFYDLYLCWIELFWIWDTQFLFSAVLYRGCRAWIDTAERKSVCAGQRKPATLDSPNLDAVKSECAQNEKLGKLFGRHRTEKKENLVTLALVARRFTVGLHSTTTCLLLRRLLCTHYFSWLSFYCFFMHFVWRNHSKKGLRMPSIRHLVANRNNSP